MTIVLLDVDGVLADFVGGVLASVEEPPAYDKVNDYDLSKVLNPNQYHDFLQFSSYAGWCKKLKWYDGAKDFVTNLDLAGCEVHAVTTAWEKSHHWHRERLEWLAPRIPWDRVTFTTQKRLVRGDFLVEDSARNLQKWAAAHPNGTPILLDRPWNQGDFAFDHFRVDNLESAFSVIKDLT